MEFGPVEPVALNGTLLGPEMLTVGVTLVVSVATKSNTGQNGRKRLQNVPPSVATKFPEIVHEPTPTPVTVPATTVATAVLLLLQLVAVTSPVVPSLYVAVSLACADVPSGQINGFGLAATPMIPKHEMQTVPHVAVCTLNTLAVTLSRIGCVGPVAPPNRTLPSGTLLGMTLPSGSGC